MPWNGAGAITVTLPSSDEGQVPESFALALRLPAWAGGESAADSIHAAGEKDSRITRHHPVTATSTSPGTLA